MLTDIDPQIAHEIQYAAVGTQPAAALGAPATWDQAWRSLDGVMLGCRGRWVVVGDTAHDVEGSTMAGYFARRLGRAHP